MGAALWAPEGLSPAGRTRSPRLFVCRDLWFPLQPLLAQRAVWAVTPLPVQRQEWPQPRGERAELCMLPAQGSVQMGEPPAFEGLVPELDSRDPASSSDSCPAGTCPPGGEAQRGAGLAPTCSPDSAASTSSPEAVARGTSVHPPPRGLPPGTRPWEPGLAGFLFVCLFLLLTRGYFSTGF